MFNQTEYTIEKKRATLGETYNVRDASGNLVGYVKGQILKPRYRFEDVDGTCLGEIRVVRNRHEIYDAQNRLQVTIKPASGQKWKSPWKIIDAEDRLLAEIKQTSKFLRGEYQILAADRSIIAHIHLVIKSPFLPRGRFPSYYLKIVQQNLDPLVILGLFLL